MNESTPAVSPTILRQPAQGQGVRRLPGRESDGRVQANPQADTPDQTLAALRRAYAPQLLLLEQEARERGLSQGLAEAAQKAAAQALKVQAQQTMQWQQEARLREAQLEQQHQLQVLIEALKEQSAQMLEAMQPVLGRLALGVIARMLGHQAAEPSLVANLAQQAIDQYRLSEPLRVRVAPVDYQRLQTLGRESPLLTWHADPGLVAGSCLIDFASGQLDAGLDCQWARLKATLLAVEQGEDRVADA